MIMTTMMMKIIIFIFIRMLIVMTMKDVDSYSFDDVDDN